MPEETKNIPEEKQKEPLSSAKTEKPPAEESFEEEETPQEAKAMGNIFGPGAVLMFLIAIILDAVGWMLAILNCLGIPIDDFGILDITGLIFIGGLMYITSGTVTATKGTQKITKKIGGKIFKKIGLSFLIELIPVVGSVAPCWILAVYTHLKNSE